MKSKSFILGMATVTVFLFVTGVALANEDETSSSSGSTSSPSSTSTSKPYESGEGRGFKGKFTDKVETKFQTGTSPKPTFKPDGESREKLSELKLRSCEAREESIKKRGSSLMNMVSGMVGKFDAIAKRVEEFYTDKLLPKGKVISNYDALVADINTKKAAVDTALKSVPDSSTFDCSGDDPKGLLTEFRTDMQAVKTALHEYRTSIKNLISAVKTVAETGTPKPTSTPEPVVSPTPST